MIYKVTSIPVLQAEGKILTSTTGTEMGKGKAANFSDILKKRFTFYSSLNPHFKVVANAFISIYNSVIATTLRSFLTFHSLWPAYIMLLQ